VWDFVKEANPLRWFTKTIDHVVTWDQDHFILNRYKGLLDIWRLTRKTAPVQSQLRDIERLFGATINEQEWRKYVAFADEINKMILPEDRRED
jgi:hypothetical protein